MFARAGFVLLLDMFTKYTDNVQVILKEAGGMMVDANPGNWEPRIDERRYMAVRGGEGQKEVIGEFWGLINGAFEVGV